MPWTCSAGRCGEHELDFLADHEDQLEVADRRAWKPIVAAEYESVLRDMAAAYADHPDHPDNVDVSTLTGYLHARVVEVASRAARVWDRPSPGLADVEVCVKQRMQHRRYRRMVDQHVVAPTDDTEWTVRYLAGQYSTRSDFRQEWRP